MNIDIDPAAEAKVIDKFPEPTECNVCGSGSVKLVNNELLYHNSYGEWPYIYMCMDCKAAVSIHHHTRIPMGTLADGPTREARRTAKSVFNRLWINHRFRRSAAYEWLATEMGIPKEECHFGLFDMNQCKQAIRIVDEKGEEFING